MSITIDITPQLATKLKELVVKKGLDLDHFVNELLEKQLQSISSKEDELLLKINLGISEEKWTTYYKLIEKRKAETLTSIEHQQLIGISNEIEIANAERMKHLVELSQLRGVGLQILMNDLGIKPNNHV